MDQERILTKSFVFAFIQLFCGAMILYMLISTVTEYAVELGASKGVAGLVSSIFLIAELITRLSFGEFVKRFGWKKTLIISQTAQLAACFLYFLATSVPLLILVRFIHGMCYGLSAQVGLTTGLFVIPKSRYGEGNGYMMTAIALAISVGPFTGGLIKTNFGPRGNFTAAILLSVVMFIMLLLTRAPYPETRTSTTEKSRSRGLERLVEPSAIPISVCVMLAAFGYAAVLSFIRLFGAAIQLERTVSIFFIVYAVVLILSRPVAGKLQDRFGDSCVIYPSACCQVISMLLLSFGRNSAAILAAAVFCALGYGTLSSVINAVASRSASPERKSYAVATYWIACDGGMGLGPAILGVIAGRSGYGAMFLAAAVISAFTLPIYYFFCRKR